MIVDVAIDQGGCVETAQPTTHSDPVYEVDGVTHYCVANMPGGVPITSTKALTNATLPYVEEIAEHGLARGGRADPALARGVNVLDGKITYEAVAEAHGLEYTPLDDVLPLAAGVSLLRASASAAGFGFFAGESRTTSHVTPAASADHADDEDDEEPIRPRTSCMRRPRIAACPEHA